MDRGAWWATVHGVIKSWMQLEELNTHTHTHTHIHTRTHIHTHTHTHAHTHTHTPGVNQMVLASTNVARHLSHPLL